MYSFRALKRNLPPITGRGRLSGIEASTDGEGAHGGALTEKMLLSSRGSATVNSPWPITRSIVDGDAWRPRAEPIAADAGLPSKPVSQPELHCSRRRCRIAAAEEWRAQHSNDVGDVGAVERIE